MRRAAPDRSCQPSCLPACNLLPAALLANSEPRRLPTWPAKDSPVRYSGAWSSWGREARKSFINCSSVTPTSCIVRTVSGLPLSSLQVA